MTKDLNEGMMEAKLTDAEVRIAVLKREDDALMKTLDARDARIKRLEGCLKFILAFYDPGQRHLDTNAWKHAEASARAALADK